MVSFSGIGNGISRAGSWLQREAEEAAAEAVDTAAPAANWVQEKASSFHHNQLTHSPYYRFADGVVHDVKHEAADTYSDIKDGAGAERVTISLASIAATSTIRGLHAHVDAVDQRNGNTTTEGFDSLDTATQKHITDIFGDNLDYGEVRIVVGSSSIETAGMTPHVVGNTIYMPEHRLGERELLSHEMAHVWQNQNGGGDYAPKALADMAEAQITTGDRDNVYHDAEKNLESGIKFEDLPPEEQAEIAATIGEKLANGETLDPVYDAAHTAITSGEGAP